MKNTAVILLAAGKSTRMKSELPKVAHPLCGRPVLTYLLETVKAVRVDRTIAVLGHCHEQVRTIISGDVDVVVQKKLIGTADAVKTAMPELKSFKGTVLVLYGDTPLLTEKTILKLLKFHVENDSDITLLTGNLEKPDGYGRIVRDKYNCIYGIVEEKDASDFQKGIKEINTGIMCFKQESLAYALKHIKPANAKKEYYLTDAIGIIHKRGGLVDGMKISDMNEALGINSRAELAKAQDIMQKRIHEKLMLSGVSVVNPASTVINYGVKISPDTTIYPFTVIESNVTIGTRCGIGPFAHVRSGTRIPDGTIVGNFSDIVR